MFGALRRSREYRRFWAGSLIANLGLWIQTIALGWLVYALTRKASWLGTVSFVGNAPTFVLGLVGGAFADRMSRRTIMIVSLLILAASALALSTLAALEQVTIWRVIAIAMVTGTATALYTPAMHSSIPSLVDESDLLDAVTLNSVQFNLARAVGPAVAGLLYGAVGPAGCFAVNASGFLVLAIVIARLRLPAAARRAAAADGSCSARGPGLRAAPSGHRAGDLPRRGHEPVRLSLHHHDARPGE